MGKINYLFGNKKNIKMVLVLLGIVISCPSFAQGLSSAPGRQQGRIPLLDDFFNKVKQGYEEDEMLFKNVKGSPYLSDNFAQGTVYHENNPVGKLYMRYNTLSDEIEIKKNTESKEYFALMKNSLMSCKLGQQRLMYSTYKPTNEISQKGYLISLNDVSNDYLLCKRVKTIFKDRGVEQSTSLSKAMEAKFSTFTTFYIVNDALEEAKQLPKKHKNALLVFPEMHRSLISDYIKIEKISLKDEKDLIKLIGYINTLDTKI